MLTDAMRSALTAIPGLSVLTEPDDLERYSAMRTTTRRCCGSAWRSVGLMWWCALTASMRWCRWRVVPPPWGATHSARFGNGNYGQCVPLEAGVVMLMSHLRSVRAIDPDTGDVTVECGCLLKDLNRDLVAKGRQLRLMPSTWRSATIGGFIAGGSGGIGLCAGDSCAIPGTCLGWRW